MTMTAVGAYLKTLRQERGLTQKDVATYVDVSIKMIGEWEKGINEPKIGFMARLLEILQGTPEDIQQLITSAQQSEDGIELAKQTMQRRRLSDEELALFERLPEHRRQLLASVAQEMLQND
jgi:transcriptional regulator with XRE-family HTH domain